MIQNPELSKNNKDHNPEEHHEYPDLESIQGSNIYAP